MWDGFNKRRFPRINVNCEILVRPEKESSLSTVTENLGVGGVCIMLQRPLVRFSACQMRLALDDQLPKIDCRGKVVWIIPTKKGAKETKHSYDIGIEFIDLSEESGSTIRRFIEEHSPEVPGQKQ